MNKVILMGRLTKDPEIRYTQSSEPLAISRYTLAVNRRFKRDNEPDADFINCVSFGKTAEFSEKYFKKGQLVSIVGRLQVRPWEDQQGQKRWSTDVVVEEQFFAESKASFESRAERVQTQTTPSQTPEDNGFYPIEDGIDDDDLPF